MRNSVTSRIYPNLLVLCICLCVLIPMNPLNMALTNRDSGVFLYIGQRILNGDVPYRDVWDHKPPVIFYLNAFGLFIANNSRWGVWLLELMSLFLAASIGFDLLKKIFGVFPAIYSTLLWLLTLTFVIGGGNSTTEYTLPLQFIALWLVFDVDKPGSQFWRWFFIGLIGAIAFFTKQTAIGIWIAITLYLVIDVLKRNQAQRSLTQIFSSLTGAVLVCIVIILFFGTQGALGEFLDAAFRYNFIYSSATTNFADRWVLLQVGIASLSDVGLWQLAMAGYVLGTMQIFLKKNVLANWTPLLIVGLIDLPVELLLIGISGKNYLHYYTTILPILSLFSSLFFWAVLSPLLSWNIPKIAKSVFQLSITGILLLIIFINYRIQMVALEIEDSTDIQKTIQYVKSNVAPNDYVLIWGAESSINFFTHRRSPSRFVYQLPLYTQGYVNETMILEFLDDIIKKRPQRIVDTKNQYTPIFDFPIETEKISKDIKYLRSHYRQVENSGDWVIYMYTESDDSP